MVSEFEKQRQANIERNKKLLSQLNLTSISGDIFQDAQNEIKAKKVKNAANKVKKVKKENDAKAAIPTRRSRRLAGVSIDDSDSKSREFELEEDRRRREKEEMERLKSIRVNGDLNLLDLIKSENDEAEYMNKIQDLMKKNNFSIGDYYETISKKDNSSSDIKKLREEFSEKTLYPHFKPNDIKLTKERMTYVTFVPINDKKLIIGGDTNGNCGIWNSENHDEIDIKMFKLHGKSICKFEFNYNEPNKVYSASYDGSIRCTDLNSFKTTQFFINDFDVGLSDINFNNDNEIYYTTLQGEFGRLDLRSSDHSKRSVFRLSNKKIGGFAISPLNKNQISTGSLDRTLKIWDLRKQETCSWSEWDDNLSTLHSYGTYDSRLSVSTVDWNHTNDLVCNGYDDSINIFKLGEANKWESDFTYANDGDIKPDFKIKHNCQTGRWVSIIKAKWHKFPADSVQKFVIANMNKYYDIYNNEGVQIGHISNQLMTNVPAVCNFHHTQNWIVGGGASGKVYLFS